jgi:hypothetical protein
MRREWQIERLWRRYDQQNGRLRQKRKTAGSGFRAE